MWQLLVIAVIVVVAVKSYNSLVRLRETGDAAWADHVSDRRDARR
jgi:hypothetical protein